MQIESYQGGEQSGDDGDCTPASADHTRAQSVADDDVTLDSDCDDQPDRVVTDGVECGRRQLARKMRKRLHVQTPRLHSHHHQHQRHKRGSDNKRYFQDQDCKF